MEVGDRMTEIMEQKNASVKPKNQSKIKNFVESPQKSRNNRKYSTNYVNQA